MTFLSAKSQNPMSAVSGRVNFDHHDVALLTERAAGGDRTLRLNGKMLAEMVDRKVAQGAAQSLSRNARVGAQGWPDHLVPAVRQVADDAFQADHELGPERLRRISVR